MICLSDNDIISKLAACNALVALGVAKADVYALPTAKYKFMLTRNPAIAEQRYGRAVLERIRNFLGGVREIDVAGPPNEEQQLLDVSKIDAGEAILFSATARFSEYLVATGDKQRLRALASAPSCRAIAKRLRGHVICLEQIIQRSIEHFGFEHVRDKVVPAAFCDTALRAIFGSGLSATRGGVMAGLASYIHELRTLPIDLLIE